jgi:hypothetical protein
MDSSAIMQDDTSIENLQVMTQTAREHGLYSSGSYRPPVATAPSELPASRTARSQLAGLAGFSQSKARPGVCLPWEERVRELPQITGSPELIERIWRDIDAFGNMYIWQLLLSF